MNDYVVESGPGPTVTVVDDDLPGVVIVESDLPGVVLIEEEPTDLVIPDAAGPGPRGDPGPSAYEVAVMQGFAGSAAEWLTTLTADASGLIAQHVAASAPHPAYDDMPSLRLIFENGLV